MYQKSNDLRNTVLSEWEQHGTVRDCISQGDSIVLFSGFLVCYSHGSDSYYENYLRVCDHFQDAHRIKCLPSMWKESDVMTMITQVVAHSDGRMSTFLTG